MTSTLTINKNYSTEKSSMCSPDEANIQISPVLSEMSKNGVFLTTNFKVITIKFLVNCTSCHLEFQEELVNISLFHNMRFQALSDNENHKYCDEVFKVLKLH